MGDFELDLFLDLGRHVPMRFIHILRCPIEEIKIDNRTLRGRKKSEDPDSGFIGLQVHTGTVAFANIRAEGVQPNGATKSGHERDNQIPE